MQSIPLIWKDRLECGFYQVYVGLNVDYRIRQAICRILYEVQNDQLIVMGVKIGHGRDVSGIS